MTTKSVESRFKRHCVIARTKGNYKRFYLQNAMRKHGADNFCFETIDSFDTENEMRIGEIYWINKYKSNVKGFGYNLTSGGDGVNGYVFTEEVKERASSKRRGRVQSEEEKNRRRAAMLGLVVKDASVNNLRAHSLSKSIPLLKYDNDMNIIKEYPSINSAMSDPHFVFSIRNELTLKNKLMFHKNGFIWMLGINKILK